MAHLNGSSLLTAASSELRGAGKAAVKVKRSRRARMRGAIVRDVRGIFAAG